MLVNIPEQTKASEIDTYEEQIFARSRISNGVPAKITSKTLEGAELFQLTNQELDELTLLYAIAFGNEPWNEGAVSLDDPTKIISLNEYLSLAQEDKSLYRLFYTPESLKKRLKKEFSTYNHIKSDVDDLRKSWSKIDFNTEDYPIDSDLFALQTGEALQQIVNIHPELSHLKETQLQIIKEWEQLDGISYAFNEHQQKMAWHAVYNTLNDTQSPFLISLVADILAERNGSPEIPIGMSWGVKTDLNTALF